MKYPEFNYIDFAGGDVAMRNNVSTLSDLPAKIKLANNTECYRTIFRFDKHYQEYCNKNKSIAGYEGVHYSDYLVFDIDNKDDLNKSLISARGFLQRLETVYSIQSDVFKIYFSGFKGFHILIPIELFGDIKPSNDLHYGLKLLAIDIAGEYKIDTNIYDKNRLFRISNTINKKSGLYKIPLSWQDLMFLEIDKIQELAKQPRTIEKTTVNYKENKILHDLLLKVKTKKPVQAITTINQDIKYPKNEKHCVCKILNEGVKESNRNSGIIRLTTHFKQKSLTQAAIEGIILDWNNRCQPPAPEKDVLIRIKDAYKSNYDYGCNDTLYRSYCNNQCRLYKNKSTLANDIKSLTELEQDYKQYILKLKEKKIDLSNWIPSLGKISHGFCPGEVIVIMAGTGVGKSALLQNLMRNIPNISLYFSLELPEPLVFERFMQMETMRTGELIEEAYKAEEDLSYILERRKNIYTVTKSFLSLEEIRNYILIAEKEKIKQKISMVGIDYLGLLKGEGGTRYEIISNLAEQLKPLAKETDTVVIVLVQISRMQGGDGTEELGLNSARDSGAIENTADMVIGAWRPNRSKDDDYIELAVLKNRKGSETRSIICDFDLNTLLIKERTKEEIALTKEYKYQGDNND